jgi:ABC-type dipeptide/oligopeptide/nickel transport system ATPase component
MIINIRGTSGSGKTYAVREVMRLIAKYYTNYDWLPVRGEYKSKGKTVSKVVAQVSHFRMQPVYVIGNYAANVCGGCDTITSQDVVCSLVRHFSQFGHVIFEGLILSHLYARYVALDDELTSAGERYVWAFLDTPLKLCLERVQQRRDARGDDRPFNPENTIGKFESIVKCRSKVEELGREVITVPHDNPARTIMELFINDEQFDFGVSYREESFR